jgi:hypothetical protein
MARVVKPRSVTVTAIGLELIAVNAFAPTVLLSLILRLVILTVMANMVRLVTSTLD